MKARDFIRAEGCARHPDDIEMELSDEAYAQQLQCYIADTGDVNSPRSCRQTIGEKRLNAMLAFKTMLSGRPD